MNKQIDISNRKFKDGKEVMGVVNSKLFKILKNGNLCEGIVINNVQRKMIDDYFNSKKKWYTKLLDFLLDREWKEITKKSGEKTFIIKVTTK